MAEPTQAVEPQTVAAAPTSLGPNAAGASLYVGDLDPNVSEAALFEHFQPVGAIVSVRICRDAITRRSLGYGYVNYVHAKDAETAIQSKNCSALNGRCIRVMPVLRDPSIRKNSAGNVFIKNLPHDINTHALHDMFLSVGSILSCKVVADETGKSKGYGFVHFANEKDALAAINAFNGKSLQDLHLYVAPFIRRNIRIQTMLSNFTNVYIKNIQPNISDAEIRKFMEQFGAVTSTCTKKDRLGRVFAFCNFQNHDNAIKAIEKSHDQTFEGVSESNMSLYVQRAQKKSERMFELQKRYEQSRFGGLSSTGNNLYIKNFGDFDVSQIKELFREYGDISSVYVSRDDAGVSRGFGFVCFSNAEAASKALREMNGRVLGNRPLYVNVAQKKDARRNMLQLQFQRRPGMFGYGMGPGFMGGVPQQWMAMMAPYFNRRGGGGHEMAAVPYFRPPGGNYRRNQGRGRTQAPRREAPPPTPPTTVVPRASPALPPGTVQTPGQVPQTPSLGPITLEELMRMSPDDQQAALGERLYAQVNELHPDEAPKITGMLLEMAPAELLALLSNPTELRERVEEALEVLTQFQKQSAK